jgi:hypothetical protein
MYVDTVYVLENYEFRHSTGLVLLLKMMYRPISYMFTRHNENEQLIRRVTRSYSVRISSDAPAVVSEACSWISQSFLANIWILK